ncbi:MAG: hypothetical protein ABI591_31685 [Kofleriaceae bacterium]
MVSRLLVASVLLLGLGADARADSKGDWSQFIEKPGDHVVNKPASESQPAAVKSAKPEKVAKVAKAPKPTRAKPAPKKAANRARKH